MDELKNRIVALLEKKPYSLKELVNELHEDKRTIKEAIKSVPGVSAQLVAGVVYYSIQGKKEVKTHKNYLFMIPVILFLISFSYRLIDLEKPFITWDEHAYIFTGVEQVEALLNLDFNNDVWDDTNLFHYDHTPLGRYYFGSWALLGKTVMNAGTYDVLLYWARLGSIILGSLTCVLVFLICSKMYSTKIGVLSALILCFLPAFTAYSKLATLESPLMFFFALAVYAYLKMSKKNLLILGVLCGLALSSKINGVFSILLISILYASIKQGRKYVINLPKKELNITFLVRFFYCTAILTLISFATLFMIWPYLWSDTVIHFMKTFNFGNRVGNFSFNNLSLILYFLIKNPALILISAVFGAFKKRGMPLLWLLITLLSVFNTSELRYAIVIELPLAMLAAVGIFEFRFGFIKINEYVFYGLFMLYLIVQVLMVHPFYLSYYNELVGFTKGAESLGLFQLRSYWGDGIGEAIDYINHYARPYSTFQLFVIPNPLYSPVRSDLRMIPPSRMITADYVVVNFFCEHVNCSYDWANINENLGVNSSVITASNYTLIHEINAMGANMALVYKRN